MEEDRLKSELEFARRVEEGEMSVAEQISCVIGNIGYELGTRVQVVYKPGRLLPDELTKERNVKPEEVACIVLFKDLSLLAQLNTAMQFLNTKEV